MNKESPSNGRDVIQLRLLRWGHHVHRQLWKHDIHFKSNTYSTINLTAIAEGCASWVGRGGLGDRDLDLRRQYVIPDDFHKRL